MDKDIYTIIPKYLLGHSNKWENDKLHHWLSQSEENQAYFNELKDLWLDAKVRDHYSNRDRVFDKILDEIQDEDQPNQRRIKQSWFWQHKPAIVAASIFFVLTLAFAFFVYEDFLPDEEAKQCAEWIEKVNPAGQKSKIHLPDGSIAFLNSASSLKYVSEFTDSTRNIYLSGEAYFEVAKDSLRPFRVKTDDLSVQAFGTTFNVTSYESEPAIVSLIEGSVSITESDQVEILTPGQCLKLPAGKREMILIDADIRSLTAWKEGILIFNGESLNETVKKLERWYGVDIHISGTPNREMKYFGEFDGEYLSNVLESMRYGRNFNFDINGKNVTLNFK